MTNTLVACLPGGPLGVFKKGVIKDIASYVGIYTPNSIEILCVDTHAKGVLYVLKSEEGGLKDSFYSDGFLSLGIYQSRLHSGLLVASFHKYCAADAVNFNSSNFREQSDRMNAAEAIISEVFPGYTLHRKIYEKDKPASAIVPGDLAAKVQF